MHSAQSLVLWSKIMVERAAIAARGHIPSALIGWLKGLGWRTDVWSNLLWQPTSNLLFLANLGNAKTSSKEGRGSIISYMAHGWAHP